MWKQTVTVQQHFNDIEWRIRGLALTAATFAVGASALAVNNGQPLAGSVVLGVGLLLWYAFYFVDRYWYHPLLSASVKQGEVVEVKILECGLPGADLTRTISAGSPIDRPRLIRWLTKPKNRDKKLRSEGKLVWFYRIGAMALGVATVALVVLGALVGTDDTKEPVIVKVEWPEEKVLTPSDPMTDNPSSSPAPEKPSQTGQPSGSSAG